MSVVVAILLLGLGLAFIVAEVLFPSLGLLSLLATACIVGALAVAFADSTSTGLNFLIAVAVLVPVFLLWFGFSPWPKILTAALFAWIPFVANALTGLRSIDPETEELMRSVDAGRWQIYWRLRVPQSLPYLFSAGRICIGLSLVGAVVGEFFNSKEGLGNAARVAQTRLLVEQLWGSVFVLAFIGVAWVLILTAVERRVLRWHSSQSMV